MNVTVAVPFRHSGCKYRLRSFKYISDSITGWIPGAEFILVDAGGEVFDRSKTRNLAMRRAEHDIVVLHDADTLATRENLLASIKAARTHQGLVLPYNFYRGMSKASTENVLAQPTKLDPFKETPEETNASSIGGIWVMQKKLWEKAGGMDERFRGWGYEDDAFFYASETLNEPVKRIKGDIVHFWHPRAPNFTTNPSYYFNRDLSARYQEASGDKEAMTNILSEKGRRS